MGVDRTWLKVPYGKKDLAKKHGAQWSFMHQQWYILNPVPSGLPKDWIDNEQTQEEKARYSGALE